MFKRLFADSGLSLDRLRALVEVGAFGGIARAAAGDLAKQSQYSRQIKELEDFFQTGLVERHGRGIRLTASGRELARISRFFLLGLSNFQRGCLAEEQHYRVGAPPSFNQALLVPALVRRKQVEGGVHFGVEAQTDQQIESRLHDLTLDFGIVRTAQLSRPLQVRKLRDWKLLLCVPKRMAKTEATALKAWCNRRLPWVWAESEIPMDEWLPDSCGEPTLSCGSFLEARAALDTGEIAAFLPDYLVRPSQTIYAKLQVPELRSPTASYFLCWNPRLIRLNPHALRQRDVLIEILSGQPAAANH